MSGGGGLHQRGQAQVQRDPRVVERNVHDGPNDKPAIDRMMVGDGQSVTRQTWWNAINARKAGAATAELAAMLTPGHFPVR